MLFRSTVPLALFLRPVASGGFLQSDSAGLLVLIVPALCFWGVELGLERVNLLCGKGFDLVGSGLLWTEKFIR